MLVGDVRRPSLASSPLIRRWPQRGFSPASRSTNSRSHASGGGEAADHSEVRKEGRRWHRESHSAPVRADSLSRFQQTATATHVDTLWSVYARWSLKPAEVDLE